MIIYYKTITVWCKWPFQDVVDQRYCIFSTSKKKFDKNIIPNFRTESNSSLEEKRKLVESRLNKKVKTLIKL